METSGNPRKPERATSDVGQLKLEIEHNDARLACSPTATTNLYVARMLPSTTYQMNYEVVTGSTVSSGPVLPFTTGAIDPTATFPAISIPLTGFTDTKQQILLLNAQDYTPPNLYFPFATDFKRPGDLVLTQLGVSSPAGDRTLSRASWNVRTQVRRRDDAR